MQIKKAVITAAGRGVRMYPVASTVQKAMLPIEDRDGLPKPVIQIIGEEALESGIEEVCVVCAPGDEEQYVTQFRAQRDNLVEAYGGVDWALRQAERVDNLLRRLHFAVQPEPLGYGHAVFCARDFAGREPFLLLLGDHLYVSRRAGKRCAQELIELASRESCAVAAVQATREHLVGRYGTLSGKRMAHRSGVYQIERIVEKPSLSLAELELQTPGLRAGYYLCFFGMHVLPPTIFEILERHIGAGHDTAGGVPLTPALQELAERERYLALEVQGSRYDIGVKLGWLRAQIALGMHGLQREQLLSILVELLAEASHRESPSGGQPQ
ncbi:MAG: sugar phosphate nucleotidyltransferase [Planctomycetota bacterium]